MAATGTPGNSLDLEDDVFIATDDHQDEDADVDADYEQLEASDEFGDEASSSDSSRTLLGSQSGRIYMVEKVERATGGYRPSFLFSGFLFDILQHGEQGGFTLQQVHDTKELQLSLRYEPPSPKFSRSCPGMSSYRLKLLQGPNFVYLLRGLPKTLVVDRAARAVGWGALQLVFHTGSQLDSFLAALRHVDVVHDHLWPRGIAALWRVTSSDGGAGGLVGEPLLPSPGGSWRMSESASSCTTHDPATGVYSHGRQGYTGQPGRNAWEGGEEGPGTASSRLHDGRDSASSQAHATTQQGMVEGAAAGSGGASGEPAAAAGSGTSKGLWCTGCLWPVSSSTLLLVAGACIGAAAVLSLRFLRRPGR